MAAEIVRMSNELIGNIGRESTANNASRVEFAYHINGSGGTAFGGAEKWPFVSLGISFHEGKEHDAWHFYRQLYQLLSEYQRSCGIAQAWMLHPQKLDIVTEEGRRLSLTYVPEKNVWRTYDSERLENLDEIYTVDDVGALILNTFFKDWEVAGA